jgi:signal transduction histidine kinase/ActR/RegA family two-component response regulator
MLGYTASEVINKVTPADISDAQEIIARAEALTKELGTPIKPGFEALVFKATRDIEDIYELTYIRKDGSRLPAVVSVTALRDVNEFIIGYLLIGTDNTARKQAEEALIKAGALQSAIFNSANFSSIATDAKGVIQIFNVGAERMLGYTAKEVVDKITPADISDPQEIITRAEALTISLGTPIKPGFEALVFKAKRGIEDIYDLTYIRKDGSRFPATVSVTALRDINEVIIGYLLIGTDNTAGKKAEDIVQERNIQFENARSIAVKANLAKSDFLSSMSHELRTPLNAILGFAQLMETDQPAPSELQLDSITQILDAGWHLLKLINEILDLAKIESGQVPLHLESLSLEDVMIKCQGMVEVQAQQHSIKMKFPKFKQHYHVWADETRLKQILLNLLSNAIKYNRKNGLVEVTYTEMPSERMRISVRDAGAGLTPDQISQLFQPFNRLGQESGIEVGTGIGLVVAKRLIELMGGEIGVESVLGEGSLFWFEVPSVEAPQMHDLEDGSSAPDPLTKVEKTRLHTTLYVEDNVTNMRLVQKIIARIPNVKLLMAKDGALGIELARESLPDLILMDINLPGINGFEALKLLRADPITKHIPVIAVSANAMLLDIEKGLVAGFYSYITKPINVDQFTNSVNEGLKFADKQLGIIY